MKSNPLNRLIVSVFWCLFGLLPFSALAQSGSFTDNFSFSHSYQTNGVSGTFWTGFTKGDNVGGDTETIRLWDANITSNSTMTFSNTGGNWAGNNDGPFLWTMVQGTNDFTAIVHITNLTQVNYNFAGLLVRDPATSNNWIYDCVFAEFGFNTDIRDTTNGVSAETTYSPGTYVETNQSTWYEWLEIQRTSGVISCSYSPDGVSWTLQYTSPDTNLTGDLQVGIEDATYTANRCSVQYQNFSLTGPGVSNAVSTPSPATGLVLTPLTNALNVAWNNGGGAAGAVVVVNSNNPIGRQPINGTNYTGFDNATYGSGTNMGDGNYIVYVGSGNSVTVTNLVPLANYTVAVYSYTGSGSSVVYSLTNTPVATGQVIGVPLAITITYPTAGGTNAVAVDDTIVPAVTLAFQGGVNVTETAAAGLTSGNTNILAPTATVGTFAGLNPGGSTTITALYTNTGLYASYGVFSTTSNVNVVVVPVTDNFSTPHDYLANGVGGTYWSGVLLSANDAPAGGTAVNPTQTLRANTDTYATNRLATQIRGGGFGEGADTGFFLYKLLSSNFSIAVQITQYDSAASNYYHMPGLMVRAPYSFQSTENFIQITRFDNFGDGDIEQIATNFVTVGGGIGFASPSTPYLMFTRVGDTFTIYGKQHALANWSRIRTIVASNLDGVAMQVGMEDETYTGDTASTMFANLCITNYAGASTIAALGTSPNAPGAPSGLVVTNLHNGSIGANWTAGAGSTGSLIVAHPGFPDTAQPVDGTDYSGVAYNDFLLAGNLESSSNILVYDGTGTSTTIGDVPEELWYLSVYSFANVGGTNYYNLNPSTAFVNLAPPVVHVGITNSGSGVFTLTWSQGTLLEATNVLGPWVTNNSATSPFTITNQGGPSLFFQVVNQFP
jgi:regulation of enolase protein 1 (concanavalin A-like superfamily)